MAALLVAMSVMAVFMTMALPVWSTAARREKEAELVFRGEQYARAIALYQRKFANALPPSLDVLVNDRYLRKKYKDPITNGDFQLLSGASLQANTGVPGGQLGRAGTPGASGAGTQTSGRGTGSTLGTNSFTNAGQGAATGFGGAVAGGIMGVTSKSAEKSLRLYNGRGVYNEWTFVAVQRNLNAGSGGTGGNGPGGRGQNTPGRGTQPNRGSGGLRPAGDNRGFGR